MGEYLLSETDYITSVSNLWVGWADCFIPDVTAPPLGTIFFVTKQFHAKGVVYGQCANFSLRSTLQHGSPLTNNQFLCSPFNAHSRTAFHLFFASLNSTTDFYSRIYSGRVLHSFKTTALGLGDFSMSPLNFPPCIFKL